MKRVIIDYRTSQEERISLSKLGCNIMDCPPCKNLYGAVCGHPDMLLHIIDNNNIIVNKDMDKAFIAMLNKLNINVVLSHSSLAYSYPHNIILNGVSLSNLFIHYMDYSDKVLFNIMEQNKKLINVRQGYTKCSTAIINDNAIITSDIGIKKALKNESIDVLLLPPGDIELPGLDYGFIGGACGLIENNLLAFYGDLEYYSYGREVLDFLKAHKVEPVFLKKGPLTDRGSILTIGDL